MKTILLVEDHGPLRRAVARQLKSYDVEVSQASSATAATAALSRRDYDIILTDYDLSEGDRNGIWLLGQIPSASRVLKCMTSSLPSSMFMGTHATWRDHFFPKPLDIEEFARVVGLKKEGEA